MADTDDLGAAGLADTPAQAAAQALAATPRYPNPLSRDPVLHLLRRAAFGPSAADVTTVRSLGVDAWLDQQLAATVADPVVDTMLKDFPTLATDITGVRAVVKKYAWDHMYQLGQATIGRQLWSRRQLFEVMVDFWSNHLNVTNPFDAGWDNRGSYDRDVIRRYAFGRFSDMLIASARHPAMLRYLDNASSHKRSVNENYGRELLELHTVGMAAGYNEAHVRNSAYLLTGRTVSTAGLFSYDAAAHWTGAVKVLGFTHANTSAADGLKVGDAYLTYLARHPSTAANIARKLAVRFVCDQPPAALVSRLASVYLANGTAIAPVLRTLFRSKEFWIATGLKTRRPLENLVATGRAFGITPGPATPTALANLYWRSYHAGQPPMGWKPPNGYPDVAGAWMSPNSLLESWNTHRALVHGWFAGLTYPDPAGYAAGPTTMGSVVDALADRLLFQPVRPADKTALLTFALCDASSPVTAARLNKVKNIVPLLFDSLYHGLR